MSNLKSLASSSDITNFNLKPVMSNSKATVSNLKSAVYNSEMATLEEQRRDLLLPGVARRVRDNPGNFDQSWDTCLPLFDKNGNPSTNVDKEDRFTNNNRGDWIHSHSRQEYKPSFDNKTNQQKGSEDSKGITRSNNANNISNIFLERESESYCSQTYDDPITDEKKSSSSKNRIHGTPFARQDSAAVDIKLNVESEGKKVNRTGACELAGEVNPIHCRYVSKSVHLEQQDGGFPIRNRYETQKTPLGTSSQIPSSENGKMSNKSRLFSESFENSEGNRFHETTVNNISEPQKVFISTKLDKNNVNHSSITDNYNSNEAKCDNSAKREDEFDKYNDAIGKDSNGNCSKKTVIKMAASRVYSHSDLRQVVSGRDFNKTTMESCFLADNYNSEKIKNDESAKWKLRIVKDSDAACSKRISMFKKVLPNAMFCIVVLLAMAVVHLHMRVTALEDGGRTSTDVECQGWKAILEKASPISDTSNPAPGKAAPSNNEKTYQDIMKYFDNDNGQTTSADADAAHLSAETLGDKITQAYNRNPDLKNDAGEDKSFKRFGTRNQGVKRISKSRHILSSSKFSDNNLPENTDSGRRLPDNPNFSGNNNKDVGFRKPQNSKMRNDKDSKFQENHTEHWDNDKTGVFPENQTGTQHVEFMNNQSTMNTGLPDLFSEVNDVRVVEMVALTDRSETIKSRHRRASKMKDENFSRKQRKQKPKQPKQNRYANAQVESFDVPFFDIFDYSTYFKIPDPNSVHRHCTTRHKWGHGIEACSDSRVIFPEKYSNLPFYQPTNTTNNKGIIYQNDDSGTFHVNLSGDYLFQQNILVLDETGTHFLALFLNGQPVYACQNGGFACPELNDERHTSKYRICNIIGLLELKDGDTLEIKTMAPHMTVRTEVHNRRKSYLKFILLNRGQ